MCDSVNGIINDLIYTLSRIRGDKYLVQFSCGNISTIMQENF